MISLVSNVIMHSFSRRYEYQADAYAVKFGYGHHLQVALTKLEVENAMSFKTHWLVSLFKHEYVDCYVIELVIHLLLNVVKELMKSKRSNSNCLLDFGFFFILFVVLLLRWRYSFRLYTIIGN